LKIDGRNRKNEKDRGQEIASVLDLVIANGPDHEKENARGKEDGLGRERRRDPGPGSRGDHGLERREIERDRVLAKRKIEKVHHRVVTRKNGLVPVIDIGIIPLMNLVIKGKGRDQGQGLKDRIDLGREILLHLIPIYKVSH